VVVKKVLIVAYHFPPDAEVGAVRPYQIARYLPEFGIEPWVLTVEPAFAERPNPGLVARGVPEDRIIRTSVDTTTYDLVSGLWRTSKRLTARSMAGGAFNGAVDNGGPPGAAGPRELVRFVLSHPDEKIGWLRPAVRAAAQTIRRQPFDAILSTSPPRVATLAAARIAMRHRIPWIMDVRDPWVGWYHTPTSYYGQHPLLDALQARLFRRCVRQASVIVHNTERLRLLTCQMAPDVTAKTRSVPNGIDSEWSASRDGGPPAAFRIGYYGQVMGRRNPSAFLRGLRAWIDSRSERPKVEVCFFGSGFDSIRRETKTLGLEACVAFSPQLPRAEVPREMEKDFVLLLVATEQPLQIPGKTYEYLAAARRILALTDRDGATADMLRPLPGCLIAENPADVHAALDDLYRQHEAGAGAWVDRGHLIAELQYPRRVERFAEFIHEVVKR
jgi:glycosyltransferase involved in cell wall biosynthesis